MTKNQIDYWSLQEQKRANKAGEQETHRANIARETETSRANQAREAIDVSNLQESHRHNVQTEGVSVSNLQEQSRHNVATEEIQRLQQTVNQFAAQEQARANRAREAIQRGQLSVSQQEADSSKWYREQQTELDKLTKTAKAALDDVTYEKVLAEISKISSDARMSEKQANYATWNQVLKTTDSISTALSAIARIIDAVNPF